MNYIYHKHVYVVTLDGMYLAVVNTLRDAYSFVLRDVKNEKQNGRCLRSFRYGYDTVMECLTPDGNTANYWLYISKVPLIEKQETSDE